MLKTMERYGLVYFEQCPGRQLAPRTYYSGVKLEMIFVDGESRFAQMRIVR